MSNTTFRLRQWLAVACLVLGLLAPVASAVAQTDDAATGPAAAVEPVPVTDNDAQTGAFPTWASACVCLGISFAFFVIVVSVIVKLQMKKVRDEP